MKKIMMIILLGTTMIACDGQKEQTKLNQLQNRNGIIYSVNKTKPFTGNAKSYYKNGQVKDDLNFRDGKQNGLQEIYYENGQIGAIYKVKDGKLNGVQKEYDINGALKAEVTFKDGEKVLAEK